MLPPETLDTCAILSITEAPSAVRSLASACRPKQRGTASPAREGDAEEDVALGNRGQTRADHIGPFHTDGGRAGTAGQNECADETDSDAYRHCRCSIRGRGF